MTLTRRTRVLRVNRSTAGLLSTLGTSNWPWGDTCRGCRANVRQGEDTLYHTGLFFHAAYCIRCAERKGFVEFATVSTIVPAEEQEAAQAEEAVVRAVREDAIRLLIVMGAQKGDATKRVWDAMVADPSLETTDQVITACVRRAHKV